MESALKGKAKRRHLSAAECCSLARSLSLAQPLAPCSTEQQRGLYPRTPTKRRRASDGVSQQRGIIEFFSSAGVLSSSPQRTKHPTVKAEEEQNGSIIPKDTDDGQTLTDNLLEGFTEEMFGDDEDFELGICAIKQEEEEKERAGSFSAGHSCIIYPVDALPDTHYGLLGVSERLAEPQGHFQDLPEEVLSVIFAQLPADDLYRHVSLVCRRWRDIVIDSRFLPWKKLYYRYEKQEEQAVQEVKALLEANHIVKTDELCVLNMVRYMSQFKHSARVNEKDVLLCVRGHRLYAQAEVCIKHRLPDMETGPNPWSVMALVLVLADGVKDVLDLVTRLHASGCLLSPGGISEYLWAMATLLLAMRNTNIVISNRWHYNVFYVLHLMENAPPPERKQHQVTHEQQQILNHDTQSDHVVKIMAFAGTGKTTTLVRYAQLRPRLRFLYVSFNKSVVTHAKSTFPCNVKCRTVHAMAYRAVGYRYMKLKKLGSNLQPFTVAWVLPDRRGGYVNAKVVTQTINNFCASTDECIGPQHVPDVFKNTHGREECTTDAQKKLFAADAKGIWAKMIELEPTKQMAHHITHDGYLKLWQLQRPVLDEFDIIFIDEAQDCTPVIMDIMLSQRCGKILVGDPHQQIYTFRGAVNALFDVPHTHLYYLTKSFRFGSEIAYIGATILDVCKKVKKILVGGYQNGSVRGEDKEMMQTLRLAKSQVGGMVAILCRCNVTVFSEAVRLTDANPDCRIHIVGGVENFGLNKILDIWILMQPEEKRKRENLWIKDRFIRHFCKAKLGGYVGLKKYAAHTEDRELAAKLSVVEKYNARIPELVDRITTCAQSQASSAGPWTHPCPTPVHVLCLCMKAQGGEANRDFEAFVVKAPVAKLRIVLPGHFSADEWNLLYVAVTRAKRVLYITRSISKILTLAGEYFLRSELTSTLLNKEESCRCSTRECPNRITQGAPLSMHKLPIAYLDDVEEGGVLCAACVEQRVGPVAFLLAPAEKIRMMHYTEEQLELPINISMLLALL
uniref:F-box DNA helicase 1 n=1 Tax=Electrophorus electricus TaxID=8005 RepID=A0A4W4GNF0_ELEEL